MHSIVQERHIGGQTERTTYQTIAEKFGTRKYVCFFPATQRISSGTLSDGGNYPHAGRPL